MTIRESRQRLSEAEEAYKSAHPGRDLTEAREELTHARTEYQLDCVAVVERLAVLIKPLADEANAWHKTVSGRCIPIIGSMHDDRTDAAFTVGDLRALAALYEEIKNA
jgi:hypothetical protein